MTQAITLDDAYAICKGIAKREAKNFYYAFVALPEPRRNAICAIYAFMRKADDLADEGLIGIVAVEREIIAVPLPALEMPQLRSTWASFV